MCPAQVRDKPEFGFRIWDFNGRRFASPALRGCRPGITMCDRVYELRGILVFECSPQGQPPETARDATDIIGAARGAGANFVIVPAIRLSDAFFQLRTGIAGEILQKFALYGVRLAIVGDISKYERESSAFRDLVYECNHGKDVWFLPDVASLADRTGPSV